MLESRPQVTFRACYQNSYRIIIPFGRLVIEYFACISKETKFTLLIHVTKIYLIF